MIKIHNFAWRNRWKASSEIASRCNALSVLPKCIARVLRLLSNPKPSNSRESSVSRFHSSAIEFKLVLSSLDESVSYNELALSFSEIHRQTDSNDSNEVRLGKLQWSLHKYSGYMDRCAHFVKICWMLEIEPPPRESSSEPPTIIGRLHGSPSWVASKPFVVGQIRNVPG